MNILEDFREKWKQIDRWVSMRLKKKYDSKTVQKAAEARLENLEEDDDA